MDFIFLQEKTMAILVIIKIIQKSKVKKKMDIKDLKQIYTILQPSIENILNTNQADKEAIKKLNDIEIAYKRKKYGVSVVAAELSLSNFDIVSSLKEHQISEKEKEIIRKGIDAKLQNNMPIVCIMPDYLSFTNCREI
jgi:hypothetical protein